MVMRTLVAPVRHQGMLEHARRTGLMIKTELAERSITTWAELADRAVYVAFAQAALRKVAQV
jgi:hypothetical protein